MSDEISAKFTEVINLIMICDKKRFNIGPDFVT